MPGGRRNTVNRTGPTAKSSGSNISSANPNGRSNSGERASANGADDKRLEESYCGRPLAPKHIPIPAVPVDRQLNFEALSLVVSIVAACLQLVNLYRTVWWLPNSYNGYSMNFYLIDPYLLVFIFTLVVYRFLYKLLRKIIDVSLPVRSAPAKLVIRNIIRLSLGVVVQSVLSWCLYHMTERYDSMKIVYLFLPSLSVYFVFGVRTTLFFDIILDIWGKEEQKTKYVLDKPLHNCSLNASAIRAEVSTMRIDFNTRLRRALFSSSISAYVCGVAPIIFVPPHLHYNELWVIQHVILFWLGRICAYFAQVYPFRYCDELHRAAMHLGRWIKIENRNNHIYAQPWNDAVLWPHGSVVRHNREIYRSEGLCTAAEPGNPFHSKFYVRDFILSNNKKLLDSILIIIYPTQSVFNNRVTLLSLILASQLLLVNIQLFILLGVTEWYQILSTILLLVIHYYNLFKMARDFLVAWKVYRAEQIIQEKSQMVVT